MTQVIESTNEIEQRSHALRTGSRTLLAMFTRRWILATLIVVAAVAVMVRLGIWQLDRLEKRRAFNTRVSTQLAQPTLLLDQSGLDLNLGEMEYRSVVVQGEYDLSHEVALRNQAWDNQLGVHLLTPLKISGTNKYILVNRGWAPTENFQYDDWSEYSEPGLVEVHGMLRATEDTPDYGRRSDPIPLPGEEPLLVWNFANAEQIAKQVPYELLPMAYVQQAPDASWTELPYRSLPDLELTEGPHFGYALQWFTFAIVLGLGYPIFIHRRMNKRK